MCVHPRGSRSPRCRQRAAAVHSAKLKDAFAFNPLHCRALAAYASRPVAPRAVLQPARSSRAKLTVSCPAPESFAGTPGVKRRTHRRAAPRSRRRTVLMRRIVVSRSSPRVAALFAGVLSAFASLPASEAPAAAVTLPGTARIWFYRDYEPYGSRNFAPVSLNGTVTGYVSPDGSSFYRDVPPGHYHIGVVSDGMDVNQAKDIDLPPGGEAYVKILAAPNWA